MQLFLFTIPKSSVETSRLKPRRILARKKEIVSFEEKLFHEMYNNIVERNAEILDRKVDISVQWCCEMANKEVQVDFEFKLLLYTLLWNTEKKLNTMTGIPSLALLDRIVEILRKVNNVKSLMSMRDRVLMTMYKLKSNVSFSEVAVSFESTSYTIKTYFCETIQLLSDVLSDIIYWQTREQNTGRLIS